MNDDLISREEVGYYIQSYIHEIITESGTDKNEHTNSILRAILNGIKTMPSVTPKAEQKAVLGKIRAEIEQITDTMGVSYNQYVSKIDVLQIIDKYKADKEDKE